jgi:SAM-dependent MidA family methyltransferase
VTSIRIGDLPAPEGAAAVHSARVTEALRAAIEGAGGAIPFSEFMRLALYAPDLGYYRAGAEKFGPAGDFVTAPEMSPLFGAVVGRQAAESLEDAGGDTVLELGAGTGSLALAVLRSLRTANRLPERYLILEISGELAARQRETLAAEPALAERVEWIRRLPADPVAGVILANEVADALPVERFRRRRSDVVRLGVRADGNRFAWTELPPTRPLLAEVERLAGMYDWPPVYESELCPELAPWISALAASLRRGAMLFFDYGFPEREYYHPERTAGTLACHYRHRVHDDPFLWPGLTDISAWVNFSALARAGRAAGFETGGYATQAHFLLGGGIGDALAQSSNDLERYRLAGEIQRLTLPDEMGESFKAIALVRGCRAPSAFAFRDLSARL